MDTEVPVYLIRGVWACYIGAKTCYAVFLFRSAIADHPSTNSELRMDGRLAGGSLITVGMPSVWPEAGPPCLSNYLMTGYMDDGAALDDRLSGHTTLRRSLLVITHSP